MLIVGTALAALAFQWFRLRSRTVHGQLHRDAAADRFRTSTLRYVMLAGTVIYWLALWLTPDTLLRVECGHNCYGLPIGSLLLSGIVAVIASLTGEYFLRRATID